MEGVHKQQLYHTQLSKIEKKSNVNKRFWFKVECWYFQTPTENVMWVGQPMKAHVIDQSLNEFIVMSYYIIAVVNHHQLTDLILFTVTMTDWDWPIKSQIQTASLAPRMIGM